MDHSAVHMMIQVVPGLGPLCLCLQHDTQLCRQVQPLSPGPAVQTGTALRSAARAGPPVRHYELEFSGALTGDLATCSLCDAAATQILTVDRRLVWLVFSERVEDAGCNNSAGVYPGNPGGLHLTHNLHLCPENPSVQGDSQQDRRGRSQEWWHQECDDLRAMLEMSATML